MPGQDTVTTAGPGGVLGGGAPADGALAAGPARLVGRALGLVVATVDVLVGAAVVGAAVVGAAVVGAAVVGAAVVGAAVVGAAVVGAAGSRVVPEESGPCFVAYRGGAEGGTVALPSRLRPREGSAERSPWTPLREACTGRAVVRTTTAATAMPRASHEASS
ncbi:MAG: hypothetical protein M0Z33_02995 [Actinomycetota bacterium]|nr:hypothetical protein [Actinomycetota bacterium]